MRQQNAEDVAGPDPDWKITVEVDSLPVILADKGKIAQAFDRLFADALGCSPRGSAVTITGAVEGPGVRISIADQRKVLRRQPLIFSWLLGSESGDTLGIMAASFCRFLAGRLIEGHGGRLWVETGARRGVTSHVWLPKDGPEQGVARPAD
jgi:two-component system sensor histidine kinase/response regulator